MDRYGKGRHLSILSQGSDNQNASNQANPVVDALGNPISPSGATGHSPRLVYSAAAMYKGAPVPNCKTFTDPHRTSPSRRMHSCRKNSGACRPRTVSRRGDGLNTAANIRLRGVRMDSILTNGNGDEVNRDQYNLRIDHNFNSKHKLSLIGTNEHTWGAATQAGLRNWPDSATTDWPSSVLYVYSIQLTSTLSATLLNQLRLAKSGSNNWQWGSADRGDAIGVEGLR